MKNINDNLPNEFYTLIEIGANTPPVKYEYCKDNKIIYVDRFVATAMFYPVNYGFIPDTLSDDGDPMDTLVITPHPIVVGSLIKVRPIGVLNMTDESGVDFKILSVPISKLTKQYENIKDIGDVSVDLLKTIEHFFKHYKDLEDGKWAKIDGWDGVDKAKKIINKSILK